MKKFILAAAAVLSLGASAAFAQGLPPGASPPNYGSQAFPNQQYHNHTVFSELFGHAKNSQTVAEHNATQAKGG